MQKDPALQTKAIICETIVAHFIFTASPQNLQFRLNISSWSIARTPILDRSEWEVDMSTAKHGQGSERGDKCRGRCNRKSSSNTPRPGASRLRML
jgi:hypothetical protein